MDLDLDVAYDSYLARFDQRFGDKPQGAFVKFGRHMVQKLDRDSFRPRVEHYLSLHAACKRMLKTGATISDAVVLEFEEAAAWVAIEAPNLLEMFDGELGDPQAATRPLKKGPDKR